MFETLSEGCVQKVQRSHSEKVAIGLDLRPHFPADLPPRRFVLDPIGAYAFANLSNIHNWPETSISSLLRSAILTVVVWPALQFPCIPHTVHPWKKRSAQ